MNKSYIADSEEQTSVIAQDIASTLSGGAVVALYGDLGSGKTTFAKAFARHLGIKSRIISPTFTIVRQYSFSSSAFRHEGIFYHLDLYRVSVADVAGIGLREMMAEKNSIVLLEWAEKAKKFLPEKRINISFEYISDSKRKITILSTD